MGEDPGTEAPRVTITTKGKGAGAIARAPRP